MTKAQLDAMTTDTPAAIFMGPRAVAATVAEIKHNADGSVRRVALKPYNADHVVWFTPDRDAFTGTNGNRAFVAV